MVDQRQSLRQHLIDANQLGGQQVAGLIDFVMSFVSLDQWRIARQRSEIRAAGWHKSNELRLRFSKLNLGSQGLVFGGGSRGVQQTLLALSRSVGNRVQPFLVGDRVLQAGPIEPCLPILAYHRRLILLRERLPKQFFKRHRFAGQRFGRVIHRVAVDDRLR